MTKSDLFELESMAIQLETYIDSMRVISSDLEACYFSTALNTETGPGMLIHGYKDAAIRCNAILEFAQKAAEQMAKLQDEIGKA